MIFQSISIVGFEWVLGLGIIFGLSFALTIITTKELSVFFGFLTIFDCFVVWAGLLPLWTLVICLIVLITTLYLDIKKGGAS